MAFFGSDSKDKEIRRKILLALEKRAPAVPLSPHRRTWTAKEYADVLFRRDGVGCPRETPAEIGVSYGVSAERIRQIARKALRLLPTYREDCLKQLELDLFGEPYQGLFTDEEATKCSVLIAFERRAPRVPQNPRCHTWTAKDHADVIFRKYGIGCPPESLADIGRSYGVGRERARQVWAKCLQILRYPDNKWRG